MRDRRREGGGAPYVPPWKRLGPHYSYPADPALMVFTGAGPLQVERWADELDTGNAAKDLVQGGLANQPEYVPNAGTPSGVAGVRGNASSWWLEVLRALGFGAGPLTGYVSIVRGAPVAGGFVFGEGSTVSNNAANVRRDNGTTATQHFPPSVVVAAPGTRAAGVPYWVEFAYDGATLECTTPDGTNSAAAAAVGTNVASAFAWVASGVASSGFCDDTLLWSFGYPRILTPAERTIARDAAQARIG